MIDTPLGIQNLAFYALIVAPFIFLYLFARVKIWGTQSSDSARRFFIKNKERFLVFKPQPHLKNLDPLYGYFHLKGCDEWNFDEKDMKRRFEAIGGLCQECNKNSAQVGYYEEGYMKGFSNHNEWVIPQKPPLPLCKPCTFRKIEPIIFEPLGKFTKGLSKPYGGDGIYTSTTTENR